MPRPVLRNRRGLEISCLPGQASRRISRGAYFELLLDCTQGKYTFFDQKGILLSYFWREKAKCRSNDKTLISGTDECNDLQHMQLITTRPILITTTDNNCGPDINYIARKIKVTVSKIASTTTTHSTQLQEEGEDPLQVLFLYALRAPETRRQYPEASASFSGLFGP
jgi:hypothetical protein